MKKYFLLIFAIGSFLWASFITIKYVELKKNPLLIQLGDIQQQVTSSENGLQTLQSIQFLRQFSDKFLNYDSGNFWQTQLTLTALMDEALQQERKSEIQRLKKTIEQKTYSQHADLLHLELNEAGTWTALYQVFAQDMGKQEQFNLSIQFQLTPTVRTLENPWGLLIQQLKVHSLNAKEELTNKKILNLKENAPLLLIFPCQVQNIEVSNQEPLSFKLTTLNTTEVQVLKKRAFQEIISGKALCQNGYFPFQITSEQTKPHSALVNFQNIDLQKVVQKKTQSKKSKEMKTIEEQLGFVIEEK